MKREVKFRVWDGKAMYSNPAWMVEVSDGTVWLNTGSHGVDALESREVELMQFTGLKDKNGVEIYEGDILSQPVNAGFWKYYQVAWDDLNFCWLLNVYHKSSEGVREKYSFERYRAVCTKARNLTTFEVIGNIYQNPELLEQPQPTVMDATVKTRRAG